MIESAQEATPGAAQTKLPWRSRIILACAAAAVLISLTSHLGVIGLAGPDEPRYAWIARAMATSGDWVTPRLYGRPWFEKPILYYWAAAIGFRLHLPAEWAARLPSALAALAAACAIAWLGCRFGENSRGAPLTHKAALWAPLIFATSVGGIGFSRAAAPDMLFSASLTLAMACAAAALAHAGALHSHAEPRKSNFQRACFALILFGAFLGLSVLAKGPAGIILAGGATLFWAVVTRQWRAQFRLLHPAAIVAFGAVALPWYVLCAARNPDFIRVFIFEHNFSRYLTNEFQHRQPFWFFVPIALAALLPWTALLFAAAQDGVHLWREKSWAKSSGFFFACWALFPILFFSFSQSKLPGYILPAIPPACLLLGMACARRCPERRPISWVPISLCIMCIALFVALLLQAKKLLADEQLHLATMLAMLALAIVVAFAAAWWFSSQRVTAALATTVVAAVFVLELGAYFILPAMEPAISARPAAALIASVPLDQIATFRLRRSSQFQLNFYTRRDLPEWMPLDRTHSWVFTSQEGVRVILYSGRGVVAESANMSLGTELRLLQLELPKASPDKPN